MKRVVVLGGTGSLGRAVAGELAQAGHDVVVASRRGPTKVDVTTGQGLTAALTGADVVVDSTSATATRAHPGAPHDVLVDGTARVLAIAKACGVAHYVGISIVGIDDAPLPYYRAKVEQEKVITSGPMPWTLLRATQFHDLIPKLARSRMGVIVAPRRFPIQPIDVREVATVLAQAAVGEPAQRLPDIGGPQVLQFADLARAWVKAARLRRLVLAVPMPGAAGAFLRAGKLTTPSHAIGKRTFADWLRETYPT